MRLSSGKPQSNKGVACLPPDAEPDSSSIQTVKPVEPEIFYPGILPPQLITI